jgi:hypothetical protein
MVRKREETRLVKMREVGTFPLAKNPYALVSVDWWIG